MAALATGEDLIERFDVETLQGLISSNGQTIPRDQVAGHSRITTALESASGRVEAALRAGDRYSPTQLATLAGNSLAHLVNMVCTIAMADLLRYKPGTHKELQEQLSARAEDHLKLLMDGKNVLGLEEHVEAGLLDHATSPETGGVFSENLRMSNLRGHLFSCD